MIQQQINVVLFNLQSITYTKETYKYETIFINRK